MPSTELENLVRIGQLKREPPSVTEIEGLRRSGEARLADATKRACRSRADVIEAAQALVAALRKVGPPTPDR